jgi:molybdopterin-binding protein
LNRTIYDEEPNMSSIGAINARNQFRGRIREIIPGPVLSEVDVETPAGVITSVITSRSLKDLGLKVGSDVLAVFKSTEVLLAKLD